METYIMMYILSICTRRNETFNYHQPDGPQIVLIGILIVVQDIDIKFLHGDKENCQTWQQHTCKI